MKSTLLKNCRIVDGEEFIHCHLLIEDHKIAYIADEIITADDVIDIEGKIVIPGVIDPHVHFREPGFTHKEDFLSGSLAAAKGGITTIFDMPNTEPKVVSLDVLDAKRKLAEKSVVNYGIYFGANGENIEAIKKVTNVPGVKIYLDHTTGSMELADYSFVEDAMRSTPLVATHAEDESLFRSIECAKRANKKFYACHISAANEIEAIKKNKKHVWCEVTPHHLFLTTDDAERLGMLFPVKPPIKSKEDQEALWNGIRTGVVDTIGTDHAPHLVREKEENTTYGMPGVETFVPLLLNAVNEGRLTLQRVIELTSKNTARIFKMKNKGAIKEGYDADLTVIDMDLEREVRRDELLSRCQWSPFEGKILKGWPVMTFVRGNLIYDRGNIFEVPAKEVEIEKPRVGQKQVETNE